MNRMRRPFQTGAERRPLTIPRTIIPWIVIDNRNVTTNGHMEDGLGLTPLIDGWCPKGFYLKHGVRQKDLETRITDIDWKRVVRVKSEFDVQMGKGTVVITGSPLRFVTAERFKRLMLFCNKVVEEEAFERQLDMARRSRPNKEHVSGSL